MIGVHTVTIDGLDVSCLVDEVSLVHGRGDTTGQPEASAATIALDLDGTELPGEAEIGAEVLIHTDLGVPTAAPLVRFRGRITDVSLGWDDAGPETPTAGVGQIVAVGPLADLGRRVIGDEPWPAELDGARVARALSLAGVELDPITSDPGTVMILPRDVDTTDALTIAHETAESGLGLVWETSAGEIRYADAEHRRNVAHRLALDACDLLVSPLWSRTLDGTVNKLSLSYGADPGGGEQPHVEAINAKSVARYGIYDASISTLLEDHDAADAFARLIIGRNAYPVWIMPTLPIDLKGLTPTETADLLTLDVGDLLELTGLPSITDSAPTTAALWIEGWTERLAWGTHELAVVVSGYCRTVPPPRWDDVTGRTWDDMAAAALGPSALAPAAPTWDDMTCLEPMQRHDRWADLPASQRWATTPPSRTWDNPTKGAPR